ncbi:MAG: pitrilysin family protein [Bacteroidetes bacterium]|nr:pitrilysin family protein [Bacteroidota bacterium]
MKKHLLLITLIICIMVPFSRVLSQNQGTSVDKLDIPYKKFVLDNGLTLLVHEDHKAPIIAFNVWYHVGSKNEKPGRTGFAHLYEHLMFNGSENFNDDYFKPMQKIGATDLNGTTNEDRTNYFENFPTSALDYVLWMESDRMGHLKGAIDQARLDEQRGVVQNEKRQSDNQPYNVSEELITKACFPPGHPYSWTVIGSMEDLSAASLKDAKDWFDTYYGPNNSVICLAGDITPELAFEKIKQYFGDIKPGPPISKHSEWIAQRTGTHRQLAQDRVPQPRIYMVWNIPQWGSLEADQLELVTNVLGSGKNSRLFKRLIYDDQLATSVQVYTDTREIAGLFFIIADAKPGVDISQVEKAIREELKRFLAEGPTDKELNRAKVTYTSGFVKGVERIGGFGGKSDVLVKGMVFGNNPACYKTSLNNINNATRADLQKVAVNWLSDGDYVLEIQPYPELTSADKGVERTKLPGLGKEPAVKFPALQRAKLSNGMEIILAEWPSVPVVRFSLMSDAGYASDQTVLPGTAAMSMSMLDEGTTKRSSLQINEALNDLGTELYTGCNLDQAYVSMVTLKQNMDASLDIFSDIMLHPTFPETDFKRIQKIYLARIEQEKVEPFSIAWRSLPAILYGANHAYATPWSGTGNEESIKKLTRADMVKFQQTWLKPNHSVMIIVGDITLKEIVPKLESYFKDWKPGDIPKKNIAKVELPKKQVVYIYNKPDAPQSDIFAAHLVPSASDPQQLSMETMNFILGGDFVSRINMNIREDKHWSYGATSFYSGGQNQRPFIVYAPVQSDKTKETIIEIRKEIEGVLGKKPVTDDELKNAIASQTLGLPGQWETMEAIEGSLLTLVRYHYPDDYYKTYEGRIRNLKMKDINSVANNILHPESLQWVIIGDWAKIEPGIRELGFSEIHLIDGDGKILK